MKKYILALILLLSTFCYSHLEARGVIIYHNGPTVDVVENLPQDCILEGKHANLGVMYDQFGLFWLPVWNYGTTRYVLISDDETTYWDLDDEDLEIIKSEYNIDFSDTPSPSLWNQIGLKPVIIILILLSIWGMISKNDDDTEQKVEDEYKQEEELQEQQAEDKESLNEEGDEYEEEDDDEYESDEYEDDVEEENEKAPKI